MEAKLTKETINQIINLGSTICLKIKQLYYPDTEWVDCHKDISLKFTQLKCIAKNFYVDKTDKEILIELNKYNNQDIKDCFT